MVVATQSVNLAMVKLETVVGTAFLFLCILSGLFASGQDATITGETEHAVNLINPSSESRSCSTTSKMGQCSSSQKY